MNDAGVVHGHGQLPIVVLVLECHALALEHPFVLVQVVDGDAGPKVASLQIVKESSWMLNIMFISIGAAYYSDKSMLLTSVFG